MTTMLAKENINMNVSVVFDEATSARIYKRDNTFEIKDNPIARTGILEYKGESLLAGKGREMFPWIDPSKMYKVFRSPEALSNKETLKSFELIPIIDGHEYIGIGINGILSPEEKGVHGTTGQEVYYDEKDEFLKINLKFFSETMSKSIDSGKNQLSIGCTCLYESSPGVYNGESYDFVQKNLLANHLAVVYEGRSGPEVAVLDQAENVSTETKGDNMADTEEKKVQDETGDAEVKAITLQDCMDAIAGLGARIDGLVLPRREVEVVDEDDDSKKEEDKTKAEDADSESKEDKKEEYESKAMDEKEFLVRSHERETLSNSVKKLFQAVGDFHITPTMTTSEIVQKSVNEIKKLNPSLVCPKGQERGFLEGFIANFKAPTPVAFAMDKTDKPKTSTVNSTLEAFKKGVK